MKNEMGRTCSRNGKDERSVQDLWWGKCHIEDLGVDGRIILKCYFRNRIES